MSAFLSKANAWLLKWPGLFGLPFYFFFAKAAVDATAANPDAGLLDIGGEFYGNVTDAAVNDLIPGAAILLSEIFSFVADTLLPGAGVFLSSVFEIATEGSEIVNSAQMATDFSPGL